MSSNSEEKAPMLEQSADINSELPADTSEDYKPKESTPEVFVYSCDYVLISLL